MKKEGPRRKPQPNVNFDDENLNSFDGLESLSSGTGVEIINWDNFDAWLAPAPPPRRLSWHHWNYPLTWEATPGEIASHVPQFFSNLNSPDYIFPIFLIAPRIPGTWRALTCFNSAIRKWWFKKSNEDSLQACSESDYLNLVNNKTPERIYKYLNQLERKKDMV